MHQGDAIENPCFECGRNSVEFRVRLKGLEITKGCQVRITPQNHQTKQCRPRRALDVGSVCICEQLHKYVPVALWFSNTLMQSGNQYFVLSLGQPIRVMVIRCCCEVLHSRKVTEGFEETTHELCTVFCYQKGG